MGTYDYSVKRRLEQKVITANAIEGSPSAILKSLDAQTFGNIGLFENWDGVITNYDWTTAAVTSDLYGAKWKGAADNAGAVVNASQTNGANAAKLLTGTAASTSAILAAQRAFYASRHSTWNGTQNGLVFECLASMVDTEGQVFNAFLGLVSPTDGNPLQEIDNLESGTGAYAAPKRIGFAHNALGTSLTIMTICSAGSTQCSVGTTTVTTLSDIKHYKWVYTTNSYSGSGDTVGTSYTANVSFYIGDTLVRSEATANNLPSGNYPFYPYFYIETSSALDQFMKVYAVKTYYF